FAPEDPEQLAKMIVPGLVMPRPRLANGEGFFEGKYSEARYPDITKIKDIPKSDVEKDEGKAVGEGVGPKNMVKPPRTPGPGAAGGVLPGQKPPAENEKVPSGAVKERSYGQAKLPKEYDGPDIATIEKFELKFDIWDVGGYRAEPPEEAAA